MENYFEYKGVWFRNGTPERLCKILTQLMEIKERVTIDYGDTKTGESFLEVWDTQGRIEKSSGRQPILLLVHNKRSMGGNAILTTNILSIHSSSGNKMAWYTHKNN